MPVRKVYFMSKVDAQQMPGHPQVAVIAINDPGQDLSMLSEAFAHVLRLSFNDVDTNPEGGFILFDQSLAHSVWDFVQALPENVDMVVVHCDLGISRSSAVAKAIAGYYNCDFPDYYSLYNKLVYRVMKQALNSRLYPDEPGSYLS